MAGEFLGELEVPKRNQHTGSMLADLGLTKKESHRFQLIGGGALYRLHHVGLYVLGSVDGLLYGPLALARACRRRAREPLGHPRSPGLSIVPSLFVLTSGTTSAALLGFVLRTMGVACLSLLMLSRQLRRQP